MAGEEAEHRSTIDLWYIDGIQAFLPTAQLRWTGHVVRMNDDRLPNIICAANCNKETAFVMAKETFQGLSKS